MIIIGRQVVVSEVQFCQPELVSDSHFTSTIKLEIPKQVRNDGSETTSCY